MVDGQQTAIGYQEAVLSQRDRAAPATRKTVGHGRVGYIAAMEFDGAVPPYQPYFPIGKEFWKRPKNWNEFIELVSWAAKDQVLVRLQAPRGVAINYTYQPLKQRAFIHILNYDRSNSARDAAIEMSVRLPHDRIARKGTVHTPDSKGAQQLPLETSGVMARFTLPNVQTYSVVMIEW
jgi:hypothetical protein